MVTNASLRQAETKTFTFQARLALDVQAEHALSGCAHHLSHVERCLFADFCKGESIRALKSHYLIKFGITARQFNAVRMILEGKIAALKEIQKQRVKDLSDNLKKLSKTIQKISKRSTPKQKLSLHQKKRALERIKHRLNQLEQDIATKRVRMCFGQLKRFKKQFHLTENNYEQLSDWKNDWHGARNNQFYVLGSKDETMGNQSCVVNVANHNHLTLKLRLPKAISASYGNYITLENIKVDYGLDRLLAAIKENQFRTELKSSAQVKIHGDRYKQHGTAINYRFLHDEKGWRVFITVSQVAPKIVTHEKTGAIGVDINANHLAVAEIDRTGNCISSFNIPLSTYGKSQHQAKAVIGDAVASLVTYAHDKQKPIILEDLDFSDKKRSLDTNHKRQARLLSAFAYRQIIQHIESRAFRAGVGTHKVNPAYSSVIGRVKFARVYNQLSVHRAAAMVIARRYFRYSERLPHCWDHIPDNKGGHVTLLKLVKISNRHVWHTWGKVMKNLQEVLAAPYQMFRGAAGPPVLTGDDIPF